MEKLRNYIINWINGIKTRGINVTPEDVYECIIIYDELYHGKKSEFISSNVKNVLDKCGIKTVPEGIGWVASN